MMEKTPATIDGDVAPGWSGVADAFLRNFEEANELGAAVSVHADGACVVDLWGGIADAPTGAPWQRDTAAVAFSTTKGVTAICAHLLAERGMLDLDAPVARYWPDFAQAGKHLVTVRSLLTHRCGLPFVAADLTLDDLSNHKPVLRALESQAPHWEPGSSFAYHAVTFGHLVGEVIHRVSGRRLGAFFQDEAVRPLGLQSWIGLPVDAAVDLARIDRVSHRQSVPGLDDLVGPGSRWARSITLGTALPLELVNGEPGDFNDRRVLATELGGSNLVTDARSLARLYAATVSAVDGLRLLSDDTVRRATVVQTRDLPYFGWPEPLAHARPMDFATGFMALGNPLGSTSFGHGGAGGSLGFGDLQHGIGFGYVMNRMDSIARDQRASSLIDAVRSCL